MTAILHQGFDLERCDAALLMEELVARRLVEDVRSFDGEQLTTVTRRGDTIVVEHEPDERIARDAKRGIDVTYREWERYFGSCDLLVPRLRVARFSFEFRAHRAVADRVFESHPIQIARLEDVAAYVSRQLGTRVGPKPGEEMLYWGRSLLAFCEEHQLVARIRL